MTDDFKVIVTQVKGEFGRGPDALPDAPWLAGPAIIPARRVCCEAQMYQQITGLPSAVLKFCEKCNGVST